MSPMLIFIIGVIVGIFCTGYLTVEPFRSRINNAIGGMVSGVLSGKKGSKSKSPTKAPTKRVKVEKMEKCVICGETAPLSELVEATIGRAKVWVHPNCEE